MPISFRSRSPRSRRATRFAWRSRCAITEAIARSTKRPRGARKTATRLPIGGVAWRGVEHRHGFPLERACAPRFALFAGISMPVATFQDFQRRAICSPNAREMRLRCRTARAQKAIFIIAMALGRASRGSLIRTKAVIEDGPPRKNALPNISADMATTNGDVPSSGIAARTAVRPISEGTRSILFTGSQSIEIFEISSPHALETPLGQIHFM
jgi:hypothetical protein